MPVPATRQSTRLAAYVPDGFSRAEGKQLTRMQNAELTRGLVVSTRIQAAAMVAGVGIQCVGMVSREATFQADGDPATANRLNFIADQFANVVGNEIARLGF